MDEKEDYEDKELSREIDFMKEALSEAERSAQDPIIIIRPGNSLKISFKKRQHQLRFVGDDPAAPIDTREFHVFSADPAKLEDGRQVSSITIWGTNSANKVTFTPGTDGIFTIVISYPLS